jgi:Tfp pilus assembly protein PilV
VRNSARSTLRTSSLRGFTFAEVLAAMVFVAIVIPVALEGILIANRVGIAADRKRRAAELADVKLTELMVDESWREKPQQEGDFGVEWPGYRWSLITEAWQEDTMTVVTVEVFYKVQEREYSVVLSTLAAAETEATE